MADYDHFARRVEQNVVQRVAGCRAPEFFANRRSQYDRVRLMLDGLIDDRCSSRTGLEQLCPDRAALAGQTCAGGDFALLEHLLAPGDFQGKLGIERHRLYDFDDIDDRDIDVLVVGDLFDDFE